ncbi:HAD-IA family hydrolase [Acetobacter farinalis]|uniref:phosphoglycolate phosphatase n=1 Tax=Acetobacter farinalis TaxID=1260984 RepID=A0ABT3Q638_9PROT|nr:HAD-IA family hydrolase [Acetobacter farinalis]MCX2560754.1 HAD-IA family hydrolase [Acetobacter farinalis]NHO29405.1 HAD-IA family hydrolase [Acetobacter farinalis]
MTHPRLAVFDMDGTLLDSLPDIADCVREILASHGLPPVSDSVVRGMIGNGVQALAEALIHTADPAGNVGMQPDQIVRQFLALYTPRATRLSRLFPGTEAALEVLRGQGWRLAVCTNKPEAAARHILDQFGLTPLFASIGGGDSFPVRKPDPRHLLGTIAQAGGQPASTVMVGDMMPDLLAAKGAGAPSLFAAWGYGDPAFANAADASAASMAEVPVKAQALLG